MRPAVDFVHKGEKTAVRWTTAETSENYAKIYAAGADLPVTKLLNVLIDLVGMRGEDEARPAYVEPMEWFVLNTLRDGGLITGEDFDNLVGAAATWMGSPRARIRHALQLASNEMDRRDGLLIDDDGLIDDPDATPDDGADG